MTSPDPPRRIAVTVFPRAYGAITNSPATTGDAMDRKNLSPSGLRPPTRQISRPSAASCAVTWSAPSTMSISVGSFQSALPATTSGVE